MSHNQRLMWLKTLGFTPEDWGADLNEIGRAVVIKGTRNDEAVAFWLAANDGRAVIHDENTPPKSWEELQAWILEKPEVKKQSPKPRSLFEDDE